MNDVEIWKDIQGYETLYQISNLGRVRSLDRYIQYSTGRIQLTRGKLLKCSIQSTGYYTVGLYDASHECTTWSIHRLVAIHFIPNPENKPEVNHKDGDKSHNWDANLEWATELENIQHSRATKLNTTEMNPQCRPIKCIETNQLFYSVEETARHFGTNSSIILDRIQNPSRKNRVLPGLHFQYAEDFR